MTNITLSLEKVYCGYTSESIIKDVSFSITKGEAVLLAGPNGCGKSTLLKAIIGLLPIKKGNISFSNKIINNIPVNIRVSMGIGYLRQTGNIFPNLTVLENLELSGMYMMKKELQHSIENIFNIFTFLKNFSGKRSGTLSGGQRQALAIAMILMHKKKLYILDEPTAGLSPKSAVDIMVCIQDFLKKSTMSSAIIIEHLLELLYWADRAIILAQGKIQKETCDLQLLLNPQWLSQFYL